MKKICLVARQNIINANGGGYHNDEGRRALDGIRYGAVKEIEDNVNPLSIWHQLRQEFETDNPGWRVDSYSIRLEDGSEIECSDKLKMHTPNKADENFKKLAAMFPNAVTETITGYDANGKAIVDRAIDKDVLMQEISCTVVDGNEERYQFTWPDKKKSVLLANAPINKTLRPCREESVDFDNTENLYIEGDNLEVLKLLQETYLGKIDVIYIDPPYNTGKNLIYKNCYYQDVDSYLMLNEEIDSEGNILVENTEANGRYHTDWLNMMYARLKVAKDLLKEDGIIVVTIDDYEIENTLKLLNEIYGEDNNLGIVTVRNNPKGRMTQRKVSQVHEYIIFFGKTPNSVIKKLPVTPENKSHNYVKDNDGSYYVKVNLRKQGVDSEAVKPDGTLRKRYFPIYYNPVTNEISATKKLPVEIYPIDNAGNKRIWRRDENGVNELFKNGDLFCTCIKGEYQLHFKFRGGLDGEMPKSIWVDSQFSASEYGTAVLNQILGREVFSYPKALPAVIHTIKCCSNSKDAIVLDFFSGSATTAHAVMKLNAEDGGKRRFIMVQIPAKVDENTGNVKHGFANICEIGKERIRRAGAKIKEEGGLTAPNLDVGFRVLKCDTSNMKEVYYNPAEYEASLFSRLEDNIKEDRTPEDLLFQVMLDLGVLLSGKIEETTIAGKKVFNVEDNYLITCFDSNVTEETIKAIAKQKPYYFVMRDTSMANDSVATNFDQIFATYSPDTVRKVL